MDGLFRIKRINSIKVESKKDVEIIAKILVDAAKAHEIKYVGSVAYRFADYFATKNPHFNRQKFIDAIIG